MNAASVLQLLFWQKWMPFVFRSMKCKCGHGFCWKCMKPWKPTHTDYYNCSAKVSRVQLSSYGWFRQQTIITGGISMMAATATHFCVYVCVCVRVFMHFDCAIDMPLLSSMLMFFADQQSRSRPQKVRRLQPTLHSVPQV